MIHVKPCLDSNRMCSNYDHCGIADQTLLNSQIGISFFFFFLAGRAGWGGLMRWLDCRSRLSGDCLRSSLDELITSVMVWLLQLLSRWRSVMHGSFRLWSNSQH